MGKIYLRKLLRDTELSSVFYDLCKLIPGTVGVTDHQQIVVYGRPDDMVLKGYPVSLEGEVLGWVKGGPESVPMASLLSYVARRELEKRDLTSETLDTYEELTLLYGLAEDLAALLDLNDVADLIVKRAAKLMKPNAVSLMLLNEKTGVLEIVAYSGRRSNRGMALKPGQGIAGNVLVSRKAEIINDVSRDKRFVPGNSKISSMICVPLIARKRVIGTINVSSHESKQFRARDLKLVNTLASQAAAAVANARLYNDLSLSFVGTVRSLVESIEKMESGSEGHSKRVANYCAGIGEMMKLPSKKMADLKIAALLHDVGKIGLQTNILREYSKGNIIWHTKAGADILRHISQLKDVIPGVLYHHEHYGGTGLPEGLQGESIPLIARIVAVADAYDRMTEGRISGKKMTSEEAIADLMAKASGLFDPAVVNGFVKAAQEIKGFVDDAS